jgi:hypothetical protein
VTEVELTRAADARVRALFLDPSGQHTIAALKSSSSCEVLYVHSSWAKPRAISKLKGLPVSAVGWQKQPAPAAAAAGPPSSAASDGGGGGEDQLLFSTG